METKANHPLATVARVPAADGAVAIALAAIAFVYYGWTASPILAGLGGDNAIYLLSGAYYSPFSAPSAVAEQVFRSSQYPPLFPLALGLLGGGESVVVAHLVTTTFLVFAFVVFYRWQRLEGLGRGVSLAASVLFAALPGTYLQALLVHSENLYLLLSIMCLAAAARGERSGPRRWWWGAVLLAAAASLTRGAGLALVAAVVTHLWVKRVPGRLAMSLVGALPSIAWPLLGGQERESYFDSFLSIHASTDFAGGLALLESQLQVVHRAWLETFAATGVGAAVAGGLGLVCLAGAGYRLVSAKLDGIYTGIYLALVVLWPYPAETTRLVFVAVPILLFQGLSLCARARVRLGRSGLPLAPALLVALAGVPVLPALALNAARFFELPPPGLEAYRRHPAWYVRDKTEAVGRIRFARTLVEGLERAGRLLPPGACVYAVKPSVVSFYTERISISPPRAALNDTAFRDALAARDCGYFIFMDIRSPSFPEAMYPIERVAREIKVLDFVATSDGRTARMLSLLGEHQRQ